MHNSPKMNMQHTASLRININEHLLERTQQRLELRGLRRNEEVIIAYK